MRLWAGIYENKRYPPTFSEKVATGGGETRVDQKSDRSVVICPEKNESVAKRIDSRKRCATLRLSAIPTVCLTPGPIDLLR